MNSLWRTPCCLCLIYWRFNERYSDQLKLRSYRAVNTPLCYEDQPVNVTVNNRKVYNKNEQREQSSGIFHVKEDCACCYHSIGIFFFLWRCDPTRIMATSFLRFLDHTQRRTTAGRTPLDEWSARRRDLYLITQHSQQTNIHALGRIRTHDLSRRAAADLHFRPRGHWDR